jgi:hypothetical protein
MGRKILILGNSVLDLPINLQFEKRNAFSLIEKRVNETMKPSSSKAKKEFGFSNRIFYLVLSATTTLTILLLNKSSIISFIHHKESYFESPKLTSLQASKPNSNKQDNLINSAEVVEVVENNNVEHTEPLVPNTIIKQIVVQEQDSPPKSHSKPTTKVSKSKSSLLESSIHCSSSVADSYAQVPPTNGGGDPGSGTAEEHLSWCNRKKAANRVMVGRSWGTLSKGEQFEWDRRRCNELLTMGKLQT